MGAGTSSQQGGSIRQCNLENNPLCNRMLERLSRILFDCCDPERSRNFSLGLIGVAGHAGPKCEKALVTAMLGAGFRFAEIGIIDQEVYGVYENPEGSAPGRVAEVAQDMREFMTGKQEGAVTVSEYPIKMNRAFAKVSGRNTNRFNLCCYSSGSHYGVVSVTGSDRSANLSLVLHACASTIGPKRSQASAFLFLPYSINDQYQALPGRPGHPGGEVQCEWNWVWLLQLLVDGGIDSAGVFLAQEMGDITGQARVFGNPQGKELPDPKGCFEHEYEFALAQLARAPNRTGGAHRTQFKKPLTSV